MSSPQDESQEIRFKRTLIATDFSDASRNALRYAAAIARHHEARLYTVHVVSSIGYKKVGPDAEVTAAEVAARDLRELWGQLGCSHAGNHRLGFLFRNPSYGGLQ